MHYKKMNVHFFVVRVPNTLRVGELIKAFGENNPKCIPLEGAVGLRYLFCLNTDIDTIISICELKGCEIIGLEENTTMFRRYAFTKKVIDSSHYSPQYTVGIHYGNDAGYDLFPIDEM